MFGDVWINSVLIIIENNPDIVPLWQSIISRIPIRSGLDKTATVSHLRTIPMKQQPSETVLYLRIKQRLETIAREREGTD